MRYIIPVLIGALIGYFTNYLAIKMLFRPRKAIYLGKLRLPFTPGVIPKNQSRIAESVGLAVESQLLTSDDMVQRIANSTLKAEFTGSIVEKLRSSSRPLNTLIPRFNDTAGLQQGITDAVSEEIMDKVKDTDFTPLVAGVCQNAFGDLLNNPMVSLFLTEDRLNALYTKADLGIRYYINENCRDIIDGYLSKKVPEVMGKSAGQLMTETGVDSSLLEEAADAIYDSVVTSYLPALIAKLSVKQIVADKVNAMDVRELESLVMSVMKTELQAVVNLGAIIGAIIGVINIFI